MSSVFLWFLPLARQQDCILEYILPTKPKRANGGGSKYWDKKYNGTGNTSVNYAPLSGGVGYLTDGIIPTQNWNDVEVADGTGPYVGWENRNPVITFNFAGTVNINTVTLYVDDANGFGAVSLPQSILLSMGGSNYNSGSLTDPPTAAPTSYTFSGLNFSGSSLQLTLNRRTAWVFASEVTFDGELLGVQPVPEPTSTLSLLALGAASTLKRKLKPSQSTEKETTKVG
ncbi:MAG: PEP-CTERM sorting domain-containing protein [Microcystis flos-aquae TF09]|uniref:PEP-CTERM sorting domain-containing protein n=1 Tax=Microcystis flos-aquae TF09 TaxID=2060473 RepID=A0A3E0KW11_9CHRO|nr:MAG: PEP-CTERM sorting domain-containing protein [Microcystis flos-aquae TF09]